MYFDQDEWQIDGREGQKTRHIEQHLIKAMAKIVQGNSSQVRREVVPDLSIYRAQLINTHGLSADMLDEVTERVPGPNDVLRVLIQATGELAYYTEPAEHGPVPSDAKLDRVSKAVRYLHIAAESLAHFHHMDVGVVHRERLEALMAGRAIPVLAAGA